MARSLAALSLWLLVIAPARADEPTQGAEQTTSDAAPTFAGPAPDATASEPTPPTATVSAPPPTETSAPELEEEEPELTVAEGRGFSWGGVAVIPVLLGDVRYAETPGTNVPYYAPGAGVLGRIGFELAFGLAIYATFSLQAFAVEGQRALQLYRGGVELRWTIDTGSAALPFLYAGGTANFYVRDTSLGATGGVNGGAGIAFAVAPWAELEIGLELAAAFGGGAFSDVVFALTPSIGGTFFF